MVDVGSKTATVRRAIAQGKIIMQAETLQRIIKGENKKGDVLSVARIAGIMAAKKTAELIPLCHPLALSHIDIQLEVNSVDNSVVCIATVETTGQTGVEMEALTAVQLSLLTIYDMCKAMDRGMKMEAIFLRDKSGGKSGEWHHDQLANHQQPAG